MDNCPSLCLRCRGKGCWACDLSGVDDSRPTTTPATTTTTPATTTRTPATPATRIIDVGADDDDDLSVPPGQGDVIDGGPQERPGTPTQLFNASSGGSTGESPSFDGEHTLPPTFSRCLGEIGATVPPLDDSQEALMRLLDQ